MLGIKGSTRGRSKYIDTKITRTQHYKMITENKEGVDIRNSRSLIEKYLYNECEAKAVRRLFNTESGKVDMVRQYHENFLQDIMRLNGIRKYIDIVPYISNDLIYFRVVEYDNGIPTKDKLSEDIDVEDIGGKMNIYYVENFNGAVELVTDVLKKYNIDNAKSIATQFINRVVWDINKIIRDASSLEWIAHKMTEGAGGGF